MKIIIESKVFMWLRLSFYSIIVLMFVFTPVSFIEGRSFCVYYNAFGIRCPGCGMTRAFSSIFHGNILRAWEFNNFSLPVFILFIILSVNDTCIIIGRWLKNRKQSVTPGNTPREVLNKYSIIEKILLAIYKIPHGN